MGCRKPQKSPLRAHPRGLLSCRYLVSLKGLFPLPRDLLVTFRQFDPDVLLFAACAAVEPLPSAMNGLQFRLTNNVELFQRQPHEHLRLRVVEMAGATERVGPCLFGGEDRAQAQSRVLCVRTVQISEAAAEPFLDIPTRHRGL
jgi:hypothetical protein